MKKIENKPFAVPYPSSWVDHFTNFVEKLPVPLWLFYLVIALVLVFSLAAVQWRAGYYPVGKFLPLHIWSMADISYVLALMHYLDKSTSIALKDARPSLKLNDSEYEELHYRMINMPAWKTLFIGLLVAIALPTIFLLQLGVENIAESLQFSHAPVSMIFLFFFLFLHGFLAGSLNYQILRQLVLISQILDKYAIINLYKLNPLYAFSRVTAGLAIALTIHNFLWTLVTIVPDDTNTSFSTISVVLGLFYLLMAVIVFVLPIWNLHQKLVKVKENYIDSNGQHFKTVAASLHREVETDNPQNPSRLRDALAGLEIERNHLQKIPTWPWQPGTLHKVVSALVLPIILFLAQNVLLGLLGL